MAAWGQLLLFTIIVIAFAFLGIFVASKIMGIPYGPTGRTLFWSFAISVLITFGLNALILWSNPVARQVL